MNEEHLVSLVDSHDIGELIKPLVKEIHLFDTYVAGTTHLPDGSVLEEIKEVEDFLVIREDNKFDSIFVQITSYRKRQKIAES